MTIQIPRLARQPFDQLQLRPKLPFFVDFRRGIERAITGQEPTFTRASTATVTGSQGGTASVGYNRPALSYVTDGIGYVQDGTLVYPYLAAPVYPMQVAWDGILATAANDGVLWRLGKTNSTAAYFELRKVGGVATLRANYADGSGNLSTGELTSVSLTERLYIIAQLVLDGSNVQSRLQIRTMAGSYTASSLGTARAKVTAWDDELLHVGSLGGSVALNSTTYRLMIQSGSATLTDLRWGW